MEWQPQPVAGRACESRIHGHLSAPVAERLVEEDSAEWVMSYWVDRRGREREQREPAIRLKKKKTWKAMPSGIGTGGVMKVMQLVP